jgi:zinc transport system permease protein
VTTLLATFELFELPVVQRSAVALLVASVALPVIGVFVIGLDVIMARFAMMHVALFGLALGLLISVDPFACALVLCAVTGASLAPLANRSGGLAGPMSLLMSLGIAGALLTFSISGVNASGAFELLWGSILATRPVDLAVIVLVAVAVLGFYVSRREQLGLMFFDRELAQVSGVDVNRLTVLALVLVAVAIAAAIKLTGALLVDTVTLLPALAARNLARSFRSMVAWAIAIALVANSTGFLLALALDQPPGPVLVLIGGAITLLTYFKRKDHPHEAPADDVPVDRHDHDRDRGVRIG